MKIEVEKPEEEEIERQGVMSWPIWEKEISEFPWTYDMTETCYIIKGEVIVTPDGGEPHTFGRGDFITFPAGMSCRAAIMPERSCRTRQPSGNPI